MKIGWSSNLRQTGALANECARRVSKSAPLLVVWTTLKRVTECPSTLGKFFNPEHLYNSIVLSFKRASQSTDVSVKFG